MAYSTFHADVAAPPPPAAGSDNAEPSLLLEPMVADLQWTALQIGLLGLTAAGCVAGDASVSLRPLRHFTCSDPSVMRLALRYAETIGLSAQTAQKLDRLYADLADAMKQVAPFIAAGVLSAWQREPLKKTLPSLRKLATAASDALEPFMRSQLPPNYLHDSGVIRQYLQRSARGDLSESERRGDLAPPALKQRRQSLRTSVNTSCGFAFDDGEAKATPIDVPRKSRASVAATSTVDNRKRAGEVARRAG